MGSGYLQAGCSLLGVLDFYIDRGRERENIILFVCKYRFNFFQFNVKKKFKCTLSCIESFYIDRKDFCEVKTIIEHLR